MANERYINVRKNNFTMVGNELLNDEKLTLQAKGLLSIFISNDTEKYTIRMKQIITRSKNGRDAHYKVVNELIDNGYFARVEITDEKTRQFIEMVYIFSDNKAEVAEALKQFEGKDHIHINMSKSSKKKDKTPVPEIQDTAKNPVPEIQDMENQDTEIQSSENQYINNTKSKNTKSNNTKSNNTKSLSKDIQSERVIKAVQDNLENLATRNVDTDILCKWLVENTSIVSEEEQVRVVTGLATWGEKINNTNKVIGYILKTKGTTTRTEMLPEWYDKEGQEAPKEEVSNDDWEKQKAEMEAELKALDEELKGGNK
jgi:hypothetical protein